ncbi:MAG: GDP-mannose 4,6-dehydratase [Candidatus Aenigmarchaeota archaeon]|nr:GDP-mannose 4,6-dehydratase [Candidatus Aenigmarchaeota archaeon]
MTFWKNKKVLVTGASGFTGSHLCRKLVNSGAVVRAYVRRGGSKNRIKDILTKVQIVEGDLIDITSLINATKDIDYVFHTGAIVPVSEARMVPYSSVQVNAVGVFNTVWAAKENNVKKLLYTSTCHVYGNQHMDKLPLKENTQPNPIDIYSAAKFAGEIFLKPFTLEDSGTDFIITRAFNKFGPDQIGDWLIPRTIRQVLNKINPKVGNPDSTRDYSYISDIVDGYMLALEYGKNGDLFNLGSGKETSVKECVDKIIEFSGSKVIPVWDTGYRKNDVLRSVGDSSKAKKELGWEPKVSFDDGMKLTLDWWKTHPELLS